MYWYTCCTKSDIEQTLEPGQTFELHWLAENEPRLPLLTQRYVTLSAALVGPYVDPTRNVANRDIRTVTAPDVTADTWEAQAPVSSIVLPKDLAPGLYQLHTITILDPQTRGEFSRSMGVIRVGGT
jgi:hypothetical protein